MRDIEWKKFTGEILQYYHIMEPIINNLVHSYEFSFVLYLKESGKEIL